MNQLEGNVYIHTGKCWKVGGGMYCRLKLTNYTLAGVEKGTSGPA